MRLVSSMHLAGLGDDAASIQSQIDKLNAQLLSLTANAGRIGIPENNNIDAINLRNVQAAQIQNQIAALTNQLNASINTQAAKDAADPAKLAATNKKQADDYKQQAFFLSQPGYDYGRGASRRNDFYKGLGASMGRSSRTIFNMDKPGLSDGKTIPKTTHSLYNLYRRDGLGDIFSDILAGVKGGIAADKAAGLSPSAPSISLPKISGVSLPSMPSLPAWLTTFVAGGVKAGTAAANAQPPAVNIATGGAARPAVKTASPTNYLGWGAAALAVGAAAWALKGRGRR